MAAHRADDAVERGGFPGERLDAGDERAALRRRARHQFLAAARQCCLVAIHGLIALRSRFSSAIVASNARGFAAVTRRSRQATTAAARRKKNATPIVAATRCASLTVRMIAAAPKASPRPASISAARPPRTVAAS